MNSTAGDAPPLTADPEFRPALSGRVPPRVPEPGAYRRILANPFLGVVAMAGWLAGLRWVVLAALTRSGPGPAALVLVPPLLVAAYLLLPRCFHYHCLDCGRTGPLPRWPDHLCPAVVQRLSLGRRRRFRGPPPGPQVILWLLVLAVVLSGVVSMLRRP